MDLESNCLEQWSEQKLLEATNDAGDANHQTPAKMVEAQDVYRFSNTC